MRTKRLTYISPSPIPKVWSMPPLLLYLMVLSLLEMKRLKVNWHPMHAASLWKALWLGRLSRPHIIKPVNDLATSLKYSLGYQYRLVGTIKDNPEDLELHLYVDADFAGDRLSGKSTSGGYLVLYGPNSFFPLAWVSKCQTSTSRSTTKKWYLWRIPFTKKACQPSNYGSFSLGARWPSESWKITKLLY